LYVFAGKIKFKAKTLLILKGLLKNQKQTNLFGPNLIQIINPNEELVVLAGQIDWNYFDKEFSPLYSTTVRPAAPIRVMVSLLLLKHLCNYGDETVIAAWVQNPYYQFFSGMVSLITKSVPPICTKSVPLYQNYAMLLKWVKKSLMR
jgi:hypothetical protein